MGELVNDVVEIEGGVGVAETEGDAGVVETVVCEAVQLDNAITAMKKKSLFISYQCFIYEINSCAITMMDNEISFKSGNY